MKLTRFITIGLVLTTVALPGFTKSSAKSIYTQDDVVWQDDFNGTSLNMNDWNYEYHEPGWVNNELQEYVDSKKNIYVKGGNLIIQPLQIKDKNGNITYTSGRVNTQNKHDFKYGRFESRLKVPSGTGFLPAFWMMPTEENLYGQWPKCGEIDIMEVLGDQTKKGYGTLHFGEPHAQKQGFVELKEGDFSTEFHVYAVEWEPGEMRFYIDDKLYLTVNDWFSKKNGFGELTYPAPFDQPFYMILNVAVGGNWPGNPDETTKFKKNAQMVVDYVKVYQKKEYNENVNKPVPDQVLREPNEDGNFLNNSSFTTKESLSDKDDWIFLLAGNGKATAEIKDNMLNIATENCGTLDYSVQVVQGNIPFEKGSSYIYSFDAYADEDRTIIAAVTAPEAGWIRYFPDTKVNLTTKKQHFEFPFAMTKKTDPFGRAEFNLGNQNSTASVHITNVNIKKQGFVKVVEEKKSILPDGNYIYNGQFQEGNERLGFWNIKNNCNAKVFVTNKDNIRELCISVPASVKEGDIVIKQNDIPLTSKKEYIINFTAHSDTDTKLKCKLLDSTFISDITSTTKKFSYKFTSTKNDPVAAFEIIPLTEGTIYIDNISVKEDGMIINGGFSSDIIGFEVYKNDAAQLDYNIEKINGDNAFCITIGDTGNQDWMIQLKQNNITLEEGKSYQLSFDAKSTINRDIMFALQRDGSSDNNWDPYSGSQYAKLKNDYVTFTHKFIMAKPTDTATILSISMGAVKNKQITNEHTISIDNIKLSEITE